MQELIIYPSVMVIKVIDGRIKAREERKLL